MKLPDTESAPERLTPVGRAKTLYVIHEPLFGTLLFIRRLEGETQAAAVRRFRRHLQLVGARTSRLWRGVRKLHKGRAAGSQRR